jgi:transcriptional regulator with XRE-family HTH domain
MPDRNPILVALGQVVRQVRDEQDLSPSDLARAAGLGLDRIAAIERGEHDPPYDELLALADGLGVRKVTLFERAEQLGG